ncbi:elongation factor-like GTPase 1 isoform X2 [Dendronephthya gigantea]|nr:elongation factor-like GTPase 1 isoform X2 [Dendronephthya gigantea]
MKSSAISLLYNNDSKSYLINLIDSPGHIDFSSEVSTAVRLCDGALIVVDVVEGVCPQTHAVLRQAWLEGIKPCLVLNKIDRLITELKQSPLEAFIHLQKILEQVNAVTGTLFSTDVLEKTSSQQAESRVVDDDHVFDWSSGLEEVDDSTLYFSPDQGNVVFASAVDGWGFRVEDFAALYSRKIGIRSDVLVKTLWGDYYLDAKNKRIMKGAQAKAKKPLFVQFILNYIWEVYEAVCVRRDKERIEKIVQSLNLKISPRDSRQKDGKAHLQAIFHQWLPLSKTVLEMVVEKLPSPLEISSERVEKLMCGGLRTFESLSDKTKSLKHAFLRCSSEDGDPVIIFVSKMFTVEEQALPQNRRRPLTQEELAERREKARKKHSEMFSKKEMDETSSVTVTTAPESTDHSVSASGAGQQTEIPSTTNDDATESPGENMSSGEAPDQFIAFARVYSGVIKKGQKLFVLGPKHEPCSDDAAVDEPEEIYSQSTSSVLSAAQSIDRRETGRHEASFIVKNLYLLMGRELESLTSVQAGNVLGIGGLENYILKSATISSTLACPPFTALPYDVRPIVRVAVEPLHPGNMSALHRGMCLLNQADPIVEVLVQETGEHVLVGTGEVHIQRCIDDLRKRYANVEVKVSDPIIPFRETVVPPPKVDMVNEAIQNESSVQTGKTSKENKEKCEVSHGESSENDKNQLDQNVADARTGLYRAQTGNKRCTILIRARPLPSDVTRLLDTSSALLKDLQSLRKTAQGSGTVKIKESALEKLREFYEKLRGAFEESGEEWQDAVDRIWAFGPKHIGPNILLNKISGYQRTSLWKDIVNTDEQQLPETSILEYDNSIVNGFQLATSAGPLCEEPLMGVCFVIENIIIDYGFDGEEDLDKEKVENISSGLDEKLVACIEEVAEKDEPSQELRDELGGEHGNGFDSSGNGQTCLQKDLGEQEPSFSNKNQANFTTKPCQSEDVVENTKAKSEDDLNPQETSKFVSKQALLGILSGQIISAVKDGCRQAFLLQPARLMAAMYSCNIQTPADVLGKMYGVISKRKGRVLGEEMKEGSDVFIVNAVLPVAESFGFTEEIRKRTSGLARPLLQFTHWEVIDLDPYWVPTTEEEYLHFGDKADSENQAMKYMNSVRRRKGLYVEAKTVEHAEKQRTLKKD